MTHSKPTVAVFGSNSPEPGELEAAVKDWANERLSKTQRLVAVEFRESLPRSTIGKIMKRELREPYWAGRSARI